MTRNSLFRKEVAVEKENRLEGSVVVAQPVSTNTLIISLLVSIFIIFLFLAFASINRKETVTGFIKPEEGVAKVLAVRTGVIGELLVDQGQEVERGQVLLKIFSQEAMAQDVGYYQTKLNSLKKQVKILEHKKKIIKDNNESQLSESRVSKLSIAEELQILKNQKGYLLSQLEIEESQFLKMLKVNKSGIFTADEMQKKEKSILQLKQQIEGFSIREKEYSRKVRDIEYIIESNPLNLNDKFNSIDLEIEKIKNQLVQLKSENEIVIRAPVSGTVSNLLIDSGQQVSANTLLAAILPRNSTLKAVLAMPTKSYGSIKTGQRARVRLDAFPYQTYGLFEGKVVETTQNILLPGEIDSPITFNEPVYLVEVELDDKRIGTSKNSLPIQAGMLLSADVVLEQKSILSWLFEPLIGLKGQL